MRILFTFLSLFFSAYISYGQHTFTFTGSEIEPLTEGFYVAGVTYDFNEDGVAESVNGCPSTDVDPEDYERRDPHNVTYDAHNESGTQLGFTFKNVMILPDCDHKYIDDLNQISPLVSHGFVQLRPRLESDDPDTAESYIQSPYVRNVQSITIEASAEISIQPDRRYIPYLIEYSLDSGETFLDYSSILDVVDVRGGTRKTYDAENRYFALMTKEAKGKNILLRVTSNFDDPNLGAYKGQYVNIHKITIVADSASNEVPEEVVLQVPDLKERPSIQIADGRVYMDKGTVSVYTISGRFVGSGSSVLLQPGFYVAISNMGERRKILVR